MTYDIPFTKKQMAKLEQTSAEYAKKVDDCNRTAVDFRDQYFKECAVLGIQVSGKHVFKVGMVILPFVKCQLPLAL